MAVLIHGPPEVVSLATDREEHLVQMPRVARPGAPAPELIRIRLPKLAAPFPDGFVGHDHPAGEQEFFHIAIAEAEPEIEPDGVADDVRWKPVVLVGRG